MREKNRARLLFLGIHTNPLPVMMSAIMPQRHGRRSRRSRKSLRESEARMREARFRELFDNMSSGVAVYEVTGGGTDFIFRDFNRAAEGIENMKRAEVIGRSVQEVFPGVEDFGLLDVFRRVWESGNPEHFPLALYEDESIRGWRDNYVYKLPSGEIVAAYDDVTEAKRAEQELRESRALLQSVLDASPNVVFIHDFDQARIIYIDNKSKEITGLAPAALEELGLTQIMELFHPDDLGPMQDQAVRIRAAADGEVVEQEYRLRGKGGEWRWVSARLTVFKRDAAGRVVQVLGEAQDITERKKKEEESSRKTKVVHAINQVFQETLVSETMEEVAETCLRMALELTGSGFGFIGEVNQDGRFDTIAQSELAWEACILPHIEAVRLIRDMEIRGFWGRAMVEGTTQVVNDPSSDADRLGTPEGHPAIESFMGVPLRRGDATVGMIALANKVDGYTTADREDVESLAVAFIEALQRKRDQDEIKELNEELEQRVIERTAQLEAANCELEAFSYSISHDLRAPLRGIDGFCQALLEDYYERLDEQGRDFLNRVRGASQKMAQLIDDILTLSRLTRSEMHRQEVDLSSMAAGIVEELAAERPDSPVDISIEPEMTAKGDPVLLGVVLENLLGNAFKFTKGCERAMIEFGSFEDCGRTVYFVRDNGAGFDMAYARRLFGAFQRLHSQSEFPGSGIGLATVQRAVHRHGGKVWAEGEPEKGATFFFTVPEPTANPADA